MAGDVDYQASIFFQRLKKRRSHLWKWASRSGVHCFRVYAHDIPEVPLIVDIYDRFVHIWDLGPKKSAGTAEPTDRQTWLAAMVDAAARALAVVPDRIFVKERQKQKGPAQYERLSTASFSTVVEENGLRFEVNLTDYVDTGLFLDHRSTRQLVADGAAGARVLNLFSYTATFSVYCAAAGAAATTSVDMSHTYNQWAGRNFALNGLTSPTNRIVTADVDTYLRDLSTTAGRNRAGVFDIIICDPPTFSNSKKMVGVFDVQRDHAALIARCLRLLSPSGVLVFSTNFRSFRPDPQVFGSPNAVEVTNKTVPEDFLRKRPHRCWFISRPADAAVNRLLR